MDRDRRAKAEAKEAERARRQATMAAPRVGRGDTSGAEFRNSQELPSERSRVGAEAIDRPRRRVEEDTPPLRPLSDVLGPDVHVTVKGRGSDLNRGSVDDSASQGSVTRDSSQASVSDGGGVALGGWSCVVIQGLWQEQLPGFLSRGTRHMHIKSRTFVIRKEDENFQQGD